MVGTLLNIVLFRMSFLEAGFVMVELASGWLVGCTYVPDQSARCVTLFPRFSVSPYWLLVRLRSEFVYARLGPGLFRRT